MTDTASAVNDAPASEGPTTFAEAFATDASPASDPGSETSTPAAAEQPQSAETATPAEDDPRSPFIPRPRFDEVNGKYNELKQWKEQYGWAEQVDREQFSAMAEWYQRANADPGAFLEQVALGELPDPVAFVQTLIGKLQAHPQHGQALRSLAAKALASGRQPPAAGLEAIEIDLGNGNAVKLGDLKAQWMEAVRQELSPALKTVEQLTAERQHAEVSRQANELASTVFGKLQTLPGFEEHKAAIGQVFKAKAATLQDDNPAALRAIAYEAAMEVLTPKLLAKGESALLDRLQQNAAAASGVNPGKAAPATSTPIRSFHELGPDAWR